jgi:hypothetical protein
LTLIWLGNINTGTWPFRFRQAHEFYGT